MAVWLSRLGVFKVTFSTAPIVANYWQHVAVVFDDNNDAHFYLNGAFVDSVTGTAAVNLNTDSDPLYIGGTTPVGSNSLMETFVGQIDELALYGTPLSAAEIRAIFNYQNAWYDTKMEHPVLIDADDPSVTLDVYTVLPQANTFLSLQAVDKTTYVEQVQVTITAPDNSVTTQLASPSGVAWTVAFTPTLSGDYVFDVEATDAVGNKGYVWGQVVTVDGIAPTLGVTAVPIQRAITNTTFTGTANDNHSLSSNPVQINLFDEKGLTVSGVQNATSTGSNWSAEYPFAVPPYGTYQLTVSADDVVGNVGSYATSVQLDGYAPFAGLYNPGGVISQTGQSIAGLISDNLYPQQGKVVHLPFETAYGAAPLADISPSGLVPSCSHCPAVDVAGVHGSQAVHFDGIDDTLLIGPEALLSANDMTLAAWFMPLWSAGAKGYDPALFVLENGNNEGVVVQIGDDHQHISIQNGIFNHQSPIDFTDSGWHHIALTIDNDLWTVYFDGVAIGSTQEPVPTSAEMTLSIGSLIGLGAFFEGYVDDFVMYDQALTSQAVYDMANPIITGVGNAEVRFRSLADGDLADDAGVWHTAVTTVTQNTGHWQLPVPATEGLYKIDLRGTDGVGNSGFTPNAWSGEIDNLAPRVTLIYSPSADYQTAQVACVAEDFNLVEAGWVCPVDDAFRTASYETATWYTDVFSDVNKLTGLTTSLQTLPVAPNPTVTACDYFGHCTTVTPNFDILPVPTVPTLVQTGEVMAVTTAVFPRYNPAHSYTATWHWGDGTTSAGTIVVAGTAVISGSHSYSTGGTHAVYVEVTDDTDSSLAAFSIPFTVIVNAPPTLTTDNGSVTVDEGTTAVNGGTVLQELEDTLVLTASIGIINNSNGSWSWSWDTSDGLDDSQTVTLYANDGRGATDMIAFDLVVDNVTPTGTADQPTITVDEGSTTSNSGTFFDPGNDVISMTASVGAISWDASNSGSWGWAYTPADGPDDGQLVTIDITDSDGATSAVSFTLTVNNITPTITSDVADVIVAEGETAVNSGIFTDPGNDLVTITASTGTITQDTGNSGVWNWSFDTTDGAADSQIVTLTGSDSDGATHAISFTLTVSNVAPSILTITAPIEPVALADVATISVDVAFSDPAGSADAPFTCDFDFDNDGTVDETVVTTSFACSATPTIYAEPNVYPVAVTVTDKDGTAVSQVHEFIVVYDANSGSVNGAGWIWSEVGWCSLSPECAATEGRANFAFVSGYQQGANVPTGNTQFRFRVGGLTLDSDLYEWLVVNQGGTNAQFKGSGTINGELAPSGEAYQFMIWAKDDDPDTFRIKIWWDDAGTEQVVYDTGVKQPIGAGRINVRDN